MRIKKVKSIEQFKAFSQNMMHENREYGINWQTLLKVSGGWYKANN